MSYWRTDNPPYYISAYSLAQKAGFEGTLEEWLDSLTAFYMVQQAGFTGTKEEWLKKMVDPVPEISVGQVISLDGGSPATVEITGTKEKPVLNFGIPRGVGMADALPLLGGTMKGVINMNAFAITGLAAPASAGDAVRKDYADTIRTDLEKGVTEAKNAAGNAQTAAGNAATAAGNAAAAAADAQKTANNKAARQFTTAVIPVSAWTVKSNFADCSITVPGILETDRPTVDLNLDDVTSIATLESLNEWWGCILKGKAKGADTLYFAAIEAPTMEIPIKVEVIR